MLKKFSKFLLALILIIATLSSISLCFATDAVTTSETPGTANAVTTSEEEEKEIHSGDLYLFDNNAVMDKLVDGNVFIFGSNVEVTGQVNGDLFVFANNVNFNKSYVRYAIYACATSVKYDGACNDLYVATTDLEMTYDSYVVRDLKVLSKTSIMKAAVGRDVDLIGDTVSFGESEDAAIIYGNLRYSSPEEIKIPEGVISESGLATYTSSFSAIDILLISFSTTIITTLGLCIILSKVTTNFNQKLINRNLSILVLLKAFVIGLVSILATIILVILLALSIVGIKFAILFTLLYAILCLISVPYLTIFIANKLKPVFKIEKNSMLYLVISLVSILLYGITLIPFVGIILGIIIKLTSIGLLVNTFLPHKKPTEEEKAIKEEKKLNKEKRKKEKLEAKIAKKQAKLEVKENKKNNSTDL